MEISFWKHFKIKNLGTLNWSSKIKTQELNKINLKQFNCQNCLFIKRNLTYKRGYIIILNLTRNFALKFSIKCKLTFKRGQEFDFNLK